MRQKITVFGTGAYYEKKKKSICERYYITAFLDNAVKLDNVEIKEGLEVFNPRCKDKYDDDTGILLASNKWFEMWEQLMELGVDERRIIFGIEIYPFTDAVEKVFYEEHIRILSKNKIIFLQNSEKEWECSDMASYKAVVRGLFAGKRPYIKLISDMPLIPVSRQFGLERGTAIDRFYIEKFLSGHRKDIKGIVMEIAENRYMKMFGENIAESVILHVNGWGEGTIKGNLVTGEGIVENSVDCMICTQTIPFIYDIYSAVNNMCKILKPGGTLLLTASAISQISLYDYRNWGDYWRFTDQSMRTLMAEVFGEAHADIYAYGNMKAAIAFLYGVCQEEMDMADLEYQDEQFPMIVAAAARKER